MPPSDLESWALPRLSPLLPPAFGSDSDSDSLKQIIAYAADLPPEDAASHLRDLLGEGDPRVWEFIAGFNARRSGKDMGEAGGGRTEGKKVTKANEKGNEKEKEKARAPPSAQGPLVSEYLPNVRSKAKRTGNTKADSSSATGGKAAGRDSGSSTPTTATSTTTTATSTTTTNNIADLTAAIAALEVSTNPKAREGSNNTKGKGHGYGQGQGQGPRKCTCNALVHPLFTSAPNCLACGKIVCALEGLQPCSFCGTALLSGAEVQDMIRELRAERGNEKMRRHNEGARSAAGPGSASASASAARSDDSVGDGGGGDGSVDTGNLAAAKAHRDKLLSFQAQNARRTRVVDEAAEYDTPNVSSTQWMSPAQRALALKKQQRVLREMEDRAKPEWEKRRMVVSLDPKTGKAVKRFERDEQGDGQGKDEEEEVEEEKEEEGAGEQDRAGDGAFARNPLLKGAGLVRPVWKASGDARVQERKREQKQTWRRVQDDDTDNEQWILDGGLHGYEGVDVDGDGQGRVAGACG